MKLYLAILFLIVLGMPWFINAYKISQCDFESDYKCEVIHLAGLIVPPVSFITVWFGVDE